jgi:malonate decarboxylase epsilon subunit
VSTAFLFPGQGSQRPGMLHALPDAAPVTETLDDASEALGEDVRALDTAEALASTVGTQLALVIAGVAGHRALAARGARPDMVAGHSVGAFAAAVAAGVLAFPDAVRLVRLRARLMEEAYPTGHGMGVLVGLRERQAEAILKEASSAEAPVFAANLNAPDQLAIAGADAGLDRAIGLARRAGARRADRLAVAVPSHCALLDPVVDRLARALADVELRPPTVPYAGNRRARALRDAGAIRDDLATSVARPVRWHDATRVLYERGARLFVEMPPGHVLTNLATAAFPDARAVAVAEAGLDSVATLAARERQAARRT